MPDIWHYVETPMGLGETVTIFVGLPLLMLLCWFGSRG